MMSLEKKKILVAGGTSGAGLAFVRKVAAEGAIVHVVGRSEERLAKARTYSPNVRPHVADITNEAQVAALADEIGHIDHLVSTAAEIAFKPFPELSDEDILRSLGAKLWGPIYLARHFASRLSTHGSMTFVSGSAAYKAVPGGAAIAMANAALDGLARTLALEFAPMRVNVVSPGAFESSTWDFLEQDVRQETMVDMGRALPLGRVGTENEIADAILFLVRNGFATGSVLQIDGGANA
ncbi:SDR family oxidoreductase [Rhizobium mesosinicum]|uniref:SDR family oxidoreductase n=1 Tax=Rhizobium mesosinicum TaxID=335017 RepID=A0ABS7GM24_9HYPH|nr:SDR family oxidoreductase [Rhizobium mesosinicum]MBW9051038.1 SDR family oxidoreductase [Rhizobium mesosinicum]